MSQGATSRIEWRVDDPTNEWADVAIFVDGVSFIELVKRFEESKGYSPAGGYGWCPVRDALPPSRQFLGEPTWPEENGKATLLLCDCQCDGCWNFEARIKVTADYVEWDEFEQIHRRRDAVSGFWDYSGFGPFRFDRTAYESALVAVRPAT